MLYEFMCAAFPFGNDEDDPFKIYEDILKKSITFPKISKAMMTQLLSKMPETRLGGSFAALKSHHWFEKLDWDKLYYQEIEPTYKPNNEKLITKDQITKAVNMKKYFIEEIKEDQKAIKYKKEKIPKPRDPNWEKFF